MLLNLGANWCSDSQGMFRLFEDDPAIARELREHYALVMVDVIDAPGPIAIQPSSPVWALPWLEVSPCSWSWRPTAGC